MLLAPYDPLGDTSIYRLVEDATVSRGIFCGSDLARTLDYETDVTFDEVIHTAIRIGATLHVTVRHHLLSGYREGDGGQYADWKLSRFARTLIIMRAELSHPEVMQAQLQLLQKVL